MFGLSLSDILPRVLGAIIAWGAGALAKKTGIVTDPVVLTSSMLAVYGATHRASTAVTAAVQGNTVTPATIPGKDTVPVTTPAPAKK